MTAKPLDDLDPREYEHPFDARALEALRGTPGLEPAARYLIKHAVERSVTIQYTGSNLRVTAETYPTVHAILDKVCETIHLTNRPDLYIQWGYEINAFTIGVEHPIIVLMSGSVDLLEEAELAWLVGHEVGHIKSRHTLYHLMARILPYLGDILGKATLGIGELLSAPLQLALLRWSRMSEFTADRAGLLACQDFGVTTRLMMKMAGMPIAHYHQANHEDFLRQAREFESLDYDTLNKAVKFLSIMTSTHPWTVLRAAELQKWIASGEYDKVLLRQTTDRAFRRHDGANVFCRTCGWRLEGEEKFCPSCGTNLRNEPEGNGSPSSS